ncbi:3'-5' exonuclease [uncultured Phenylobacterium sp.]|uniref:3'-5' exonuclease n=1 Tax=uncultured Phenylobacterium sp. TaxID=349273 RepID=UPI0025F1A2C4|nr:3'-5' exonuclease [uncultured Phenylobacterium sp.]
MDFRIADTFTDALARLPAAEQKAVKVSVLDLQLDPSAPGLQMHRIDKSKDPNFWSARVNRDLRLVLHKTASSILVAYVDHHDRAYAWAERRRIEAHPRTGAVQIVEVRERVEEAQPDLARLWTEAPVTAPSPVVAPAAPLFAKLDNDALLAVGVPEDWLFPVQAATETGFFELAEHLPAEAAEALLDYAATGVLRRPEAVVQPETPADPFRHPDALRRFLTVESTDELRAALDAPWDKWSVFLHPSQRAVVERSYNGPARVAGSAGTGKTVVAVHRAFRLIRDDPTARVLLTTFSEPLAGSLRGKLAVLAGPDTSIVPRITVASFEGLAVELFQLAFGRKPRVATADQVEGALAIAARDAGLKGFSQRFLAAEWASVIDAWRVGDAGAYAEVPRLGRKNRLGSRQREALWPVFEAAGGALNAQSVLTSAGVFHALADHYAAKADKPFTHVVVDEAQDLGVPELLLLCAIAPEGQDRLFFAGDLGQRIFQQPFSWKALGADVRGRSTTLKVNYRTSQQIREAADRLLPNMVRDVDGREEERRGTISVFEGPSPEISLSADGPAEADRVADFIREAIASGVAPAEIGVFVRSRRELPRARAAVEAADQQPVELSERQIDVGDRIAIGTMHLAKGLEFKAVAVMACDDEVLPSAERIDSVVEESDLDDVYETERHLLYVACTRARDRLLVSGVLPGSEFLADFA